MANILDCNIVVTVFKLQSRTVQLTGSVEYADCISTEGQDLPNKCPGYDIKQSEWPASSNAGSLGNAEYLFIAITSWSILSQSGSIDKVLSMGYIELFDIKTECK